MKYTRAALALLLALAACDTAAEEDVGVTPDTLATDSLGAAPAAAPAAGALLDPNQVTREQLLGLPGLDAALADSLVAGQPYRDMLAVDRVLAGKLSEEQRDSVYARLFLPIDVNRASDEEILLIPGVGPRMQGEFKEYRPYGSIEEFRREIGKYVDEEELARLERYVVVRSGSAP